MSNFSSWVGFIVGLIFLPSVRRGTQIALDQWAKDPEPRADPQDTWHWDRHDDYDPPAVLGWWAISGEALMQGLRRVAAGESPDLIYAELYANTSEGSER